MGRCVLSELALNRVCQNLSNESPADVWLDWALCRQCLSGELSRCLPLSISQCLPSNLSRELLWCFPGSTHNLSSNICLLGWCVLSELALNCVCQYLPNENPANVCLDCALCCHCLSGELSRCLPLSISQCLPLICLGSLFWCFSRSARRLLTGLDRCSSWACSQLSSCQCPRWESC